MYATIAKSVTRLLLKNHIIQEDSKEVYEFGFESIVSQVLGFLWLFLLGVCCGHMWEAVIFYVVFKYARKFAGGYHASTYVACNTIYLLVFLINIFAYSVFPKGAAGAAAVGILLLFSVVTVFILSPIENPNNPIPQGKEKRYWLFAVLIAMVMVTISVILYLFHISIYKIVVSGMSSAAVFMYVEKIYRKGKGKVK